MVYAKVTSTLSALALTWISAMGCGDDGVNASGGGGSSSGTGGEGVGAARPGTDFIDPASYDCRATGPFEAGARPHELSCVADAACASRFITAHRMGNPFAPENTLSALRASILLGVDIVETDVRYTKDERVVLLHDAEIDRTLEGSGNVWDFTLDELKAMNVKLEFLDPAGGDFSCETIPTLEEAMALAEGQIIVELEVKNVEAGVLAAEYLRDEGLYAHAYLQCRPDECEVVRAAVPDVPIMLRIESVAELDLLDTLDPPPILVEVDASMEFLNEEVLGRIHDAGAKVFTNAFTNADVGAITGDLSGYEVLFDRGPDVIQTEFPHLALYTQERIEPLDPESP